MGVYIYTKLPSEYQEVEYIRTSGTQCINTGLTTNGNDNTELEADIRYYNNSSSYQANGKNNRYWLFFGVSNSNKYYGGSGNYWGETSVTNDNSKHNFKISTSETKLYIDGTGYSVAVNTNTAATSTKHIGIGAVYGGDSDSAESFSSEDIFSFKITQGGTLVRDFVPCYRIADSVIGLYDLVNSAFYTNAGTGTFSKGSDVSANLHMMELKNAYIGEVWTPTSNTLAYFPLQENLNDYSGNSRVLSTSGTKTTIGYNFTSNTEITGGITGANFVCFWIKVNSASGTGACLTCSISNPRMSYYPYASTYLNNKFYVTYDSSRSYQTANGPTNINTWHFICIGYDGSKTIYGIDGVVSTLYNGKGYDRGTDARILWVDSGISANVNFSEIIYEKVCWTAEEISHYYDITKSNYGL